jgi:hypothetical protein
MNEWLSSILATKLETGYFKKKEMEALNRIF